MSFKTLNQFGQQSLQSKKLMLMLQMLFIHVAVSRNMILVLVSLHVEGKRGKKIQTKKQIEEI